MPLIELVGAAGIVFIGVLFYLVRQIPRYVSGATLVVVGVGIATSSELNEATFANWVTMLLALASTAFGLLIVRVMLIRSVSLNLLGSLKERRPDTFGEEIQSRLGDMRKFGLVSGSADSVQLTSFGKTVGAAIRGIYTVLRIQA